MRAIKLCLIILFVTTMVQAAEEETRVKKYKDPFKPLFFPITIGVVAAIIIIKILLAISFFGTITTALHLFGGLKCLFGKLAYKHEPIYYSSPHEHEHFSPYDHYSHDHDSSEGPELPELRNDEDLDGARKYVHHDVRKRSLGDQASNGLEAKRSKLNDNCKRKAICELHAKARKNPLYAYQLFFIRKDGLAKYWDRDIKRTYSDCAKAFPCSRRATFLK